jgi:hypothetical protein
MHGQLRHGLVLGLSVLLAGLFTTGRVDAQTYPPGEGGDLINYAYGTIFGTGYYQLSDRQVALIRVPIGYQLREATQEQFGIRLEMPTTFSLQNYDFKDIPELDFDNVAAISLLPGVKFNLLLSDRWELDPAGYIGWGRDLSNNLDSIIYAAGVTSRYRLDVAYPILTVGADAIANGYTPEQGASKAITRFGLGLDAKFPTKWNIGSRNMFVGLYGTMYVFGNEVEFRTIGEEPISVRSSYEIGLALGGDPSFKLLGLKFDRIGLAYRVSAAVDAILLVTKFPF